MTRLDLPPLRASSVHVWSLDLWAMKNEEGDPEALLSVDELQRAQRLVQAEDRIRFTTTRSFLRRILAEYSATLPSELRFAYSPKGKPSLESPASDLLFSVSHSGRRALIAVTRAQQVGVDVEAIRENVEIFELAERFFSASECERLRAAPAQKAREAFFRIWTAKESFIKASGDGLSRQLNSFDVDLNENLDASLKATRPNSAEARRWRILALPTSAGYASALAIESPANEPELIHFP